MSSSDTFSEERAQGQRIEGYCKIIWGGHCDSELDIETDDCVSWGCIVKRDFGTEYGPPLTMTTLCSSETAAWNELERMLRLWAEQVRSGRPMTKAQNLDIFGGPRGEYRQLLEDFRKFCEKHEGRSIS